MKIPYKVIDGIIYVDARVEVTEHFLNNMPTFDTNGEGGYFIMDHVRPGKPTRAFGDVALVFLEEPKKAELPAVLTMEYNAPDLGNVQVQYQTGVDPLKQDGLAGTCTVLKTSEESDSNRRGDIENFYKNVTELLEKKSLTGLGTTVVKDMRNLPGAVTNEQINWGKIGLAQEKHVDNQEYLKRLAQEYAKRQDEEKEPTMEEWYEALKKFRETPTVLIHGSVTMLTKLGFQKRNACSWHHPLFGEDREDNWMHFDPETDKIEHVIPKMYHYGYNKGRQNLRFEIKKALDIPLH